MIDNVIKEKCTGCEACANVCPQYCIVMKADAEGFLQPIVDYDMCISCQKCLNSCPVLNFERNHSNIVDKKKAYAYKSLNDKYRAISSSGAVFPSLAYTFIAQGGVVYGAAFDDTFKLKHMRVDEEPRLPSLMGSKYLQSKMGDIYISVKKDINDGKSVLFSGTTCEIEGLIAYLGCNPDKLFCTDLICMGVPSPMVWEKYKKTFFDTQNIISINFKNKQEGWHSFSFHLNMKDGTVFHENGLDNAYFECMFKGYTLRKSCFTCPYKCESKISDLTMADCWGCENYANDLDDNRGLSMVICHSEKGERLLQILESQGIMRQFDYENVLKYNPYYYMHHELADSGRQQFFRLLKATPKKAFEKYGKNPNKTLVKQVNNSIRKTFRKIAGK